MIFSNPRYSLKEEDRQFLDYIPPISILLGGVIFITGSILAIILYQTPNGGYQIFDQFFSELGIRQDYVYTTNSGATEQRYAPPYPEIFNTTLYASGFLMIPFFLFSYRQMRNNSKISNFFLVIATISGVAAGPALIGVGVFDLSFDASAYWQEHGFWVSWLYILLTVTAISWLIMLLTSTNLPYRGTQWIFLDYGFLTVLTIMTLINIIDGLNIILVSQIAILNQFPIETYQKLIAFIFFIYYGLVVGVRLTKTKYDNTPVRDENKSQSQVDALFCTNCGAENPLNSPFCSECGEKFQIKQ